MTKLDLLPFAKHIKNITFKLVSYTKWAALKKQNVIWLELGSGAKKGANGWTTIDMFGADIRHDLRNGIPLPSGSVERIYTSHMFEHIPYKSLIIFINECFRVLKKDGELSVCVPNAGYYIRAYINGEIFSTANEGYGPALVDTNSLIDQVNYIAYMDDLHKYMFDEENLINTLKKANFRNVCLREYDADIDLKSRDYESIYAVAVK
jgi:predicted SAM-dependent methyltransferase